MVRRSWVGIFLGVNRLSQECRFSIQEPLSDVIIRAVIAKELGLKVRFTVEDASRTEWDQIESTYGAPLSPGQTAFALPTPLEFFARGK